MNRECWQDVITLLLCLFHLDSSATRIFEQTPQVVQEMRSTETLYDSLHFFDVRWCVRRSSSECDWQDGWYERVFRLALDFHSWYVAVTCVYAGHNPTHVTEGVLTCVISLISPFLISDFPQDAKWLSRRDRQFVNERLLEDVGDPTVHEPLTIAIIAATLKECR